MSNLDWLFAEPPRPLECDLNCAGSRPYGGDSFHLCTLCRACEAYYDLGVAAHAVARLLVALAP